jgi:hypothetical protein
MMSEKIRPHHLKRKAILYVRQSSAHQVLHNRESSALQYAMRDRLIALGTDSECSKGKATLANVLARAAPGLRLNEHIEEDGAIAALAQVEEPERAGGQAGS